MQRESIRKQTLSKKWEDVRRGWYKFSRNPLSIIGLVVVCIILFVALFSPYVSPYPESAGKFINFYEASQPPSLTHLCGTDVFGRDILTRVFFGCRFSLMMGATVLALIVPAGVIMGLIAGYYRGRWLDTVIMRITDVFIALPPLILALAVCSVLTPGIFHAMLAISIAWWPWYTRMVYGIASSLKSEFFVQAAEVTGASRTHILFREILPNCIAPILTKMSLDMAWIILIGSSLSFVGLGAQPPTPDLGSMVADGSKYLPEQWWISIFPAFAIVLIVLGFNLLGDGIRDTLGAEGG
ncbi:MAG: ABC transporter permease [Candidatus Aerophobetes bacterium]|nr:ABC transporter permease [Candidatus Aerophobetes bacterium]